MKITLNLIAMLGLSAAIGSASIITTLDTFNDTQQAISNPSGSPCASPTAAPTSAAPEAAGGYRTITAAGNTGGCATADTDFTLPNGYAASLPGGTAGTFTIVWNGTDAGNTLINSIDADFVAGFSFSARQDADAPPNEASSVVFRVCTNADGTGTCADTTPAALINSQVFANYSAVLPSTMSDINYIRMTLTGGSERDVFIDFINVDIPEPGTFVMAAGALLALGLMKRRAA